MCYVLACVRACARVRVRVRVCVCVRVACLVSMIEQAYHVTTHCVFYVAIYFWAAHSMTLWERYLTKWPVT